MICSLADVGIFPTTASRVILIFHLMIAVFALGTVTHHWWRVVRGRTAGPLLGKYAVWAAVAYPLSWVVGVIIYPTYNVLLRKAPNVGLQFTSKWAVGLFEWKEHFGTLAVVMLPLLVASAFRFDALSRAERATYKVATWLFTLFVYYAFVVGGLVTAVKSF
ncbi:MAG: hypothetical protein PHU85_07740 [Phycisphaerae bacterium]|nr:hypothetical protein [Phycisphaerae bacterium]